MTFINDLKNSFYSPHFYGSLRERRLGSSFNYFFSLVAILSFVTAFVLGSEFSPMFSATSLKQLVDYYPKELALALKNGIISTNVVEPYIVKNSFGFWKGNGQANFVVIDTKNDFSLELLRKYDTGVWVGRDFIANTRGRGQFQLTETAGMPDFSLNQARLLHWAEVVGSHHFWLSIGLFFLLFAFFYGFFALKLLWLIVLALAVILFGKLKQVPLSFKSSYQILLHAVTVPLIFSVILMISGLNEPFPFFFTILLLIIAFVNVKSHYTTVLEP